MWLFNRKYYNYGILYILTYFLCMGVLLDVYLWTMCELNTYVGQKKASSHLELKLRPVVTGS